MTYQSEPRPYFLTRHLAEALLTARQRENARAEAVILQLLQVHSHAMSHENAQAQELPACLSVLAACIQQQVLAGTWTDA